MSEWQPIETAPKDGEAVLLYKSDDQRSGPYMVSGYWGEWPHGEAITTECWIACHGFCLRPPTHWRTLPEPPNRTGSGA